MAIATPAVANSAFSNAPAPFTPSQTAAQNYAASLDGAKGGSSGNSGSSGLTTGLTPGFNYTPAQATADGQTLPSGTPVPISSTPTPTPTPPPVSPVFTGATTGLLNAPAQNAAITAGISGIGSEYGSEIDQLNRIYGGMAEGDEAGHLGPVGAGSAQLASNALANRLSGIGTAETAALAPYQEELTGQAQAQSGLASAASATQPSGTFPFVFNPSTGQFTSGTAGGSTEATEALNPVADLPSIAQQVISGQLSPTQALSMGGSVQNFQAALDQAIQTASGGKANLASLQGQFDANQQNTTTLGTATATGEAGVLSSLPALQSANTAAQGISNTITSYLAQNPQLNPSTLVASNAVQQWLQGQQLSNPQYQTLFDYLNEYTNTLAPILGVGGSPTNLKTEISQGFINAAASGESISQVLSNIGSLATSKIANLASGGTGGGVVNSPTSSNNPLGI